MRTAGIKIFKYLNSIKMTSGPDNTRRENRRKGESRLRTGNNRPDVFYNMYMSTLLEALRTERGRHVAGAVFLAGFSAMFLFCGYEFIRSPAESIFIEQFGAGAKPYAIA